MVRGTKMMKVVKTMRSMEIHDTFDSMDNLTVHGTSHSLPEEQCKQLKYIKRAPKELFLCAQRAQRVFFLGPKRAQKAGGCLFCTPPFFSPTGPRGPPPPLPEGQGELRKL